MTTRKQITIGELERNGAIIAIQDGNHGEKHPVAADYVTTGIPFLMASDVKDGTVDLVNCKFITKAQADSLRIGFARSGDVLLTHKGTVGNVAVLPQIDGYVMLTPQVTYYRLNDEKLSNRYLRYAFAEPSFQARLIARSAQSTRPYIGITAQRDLEITWVERHVQEQMACILSAYDDLIENNTRRIRVLEQMAQMLYREWFVNLCFPGHEKARMVDSELGQIPGGWTASTLGEVAGVNELSIKDDPPEEISYIDIASVSTGSVDSVARLPFSMAPGRARRIVREGDTIWSTVRPNRKSFALILRPEVNLVVSTGFAVLSPRTISYSYLYCATTTDEFANYLTNHTTGSAYPAVNPKDFEAATILIPPRVLLDKFHNTVAPMLQLRHVLRMRNACLRTTRDFLLPKLVSGEVSVEQIEAAVPAQTV